MKSRHGKLSSRDFTAKKNKHFDKLFAALEL
jgi:hypothetical protein